MSDYETTQRRRNIIVGIFVIAAMAAIFWMIFIFGDLPLFVSKWKSYEVLVQFPTAPGVQENTPVRFCGYQIGRVTNVKPPDILKDLDTGKHYHQTIVVLSIDKKYANIPDDVEVKLMTRGLGSSYIEMKVQPFDIAEGSKEVLHAGSKIQGSKGVTSEFFPEESQKKLDELAAGLTTLVRHSNDIIGDPNNKEHFKQTLANLAKATDQASHTLKEFQELAAAGTTTLNKVVEDVNETTRQFNKTLIEFQKFSATGTETMKSADAKAERLVASMVDTSGELGKTLTQLRVILEKVNNGEGSAARLLNDGRFYESLLENTQQVDSLLEELKAFIIQSKEKGLPIKLK